MKPKPLPEMPPTMRYEKRERVAIITINRPEAMNAFTAEMLRAMDAAFADFNADPGLWVAILTAAGEKSSGDTASTSTTSDTASKTESAAPKTTSSS